MVADGSMTIAGPTRRPASWFRVTTGTSIARPSKIASSRTSTASPFPPALLPPGPRSNSSIPVRRIATISIGASGLQCPYRSSYRLWKLALNSSSAAVPGSGTGQRVLLADVAELDDGLEPHLGPGLVVDLHLPAHPVLEPGDRLVKVQDGLVEPPVESGHGGVPDIPLQHAPRREDTGIPGDDHPLHLEFLGQEGGVQRAGPAEGNDREVPWMQAPVPP